MISNDERREVAARLRNYGNLRESFKESPICGFINALGFGVYLDWEGVCNRIADLIEPEPERTCEMPMVFEDDEGNELDSSAAYFRYYKCSNCGEIMEHYKHEHWSYCPNCGARVVDDEG